MLAPPVLLMRTSNAMHKRSDTDQSASDDENKNAGDEMIEVGSKNVCQMWCGFVPGGSNAFRLGLWTDTRQGYAISFREPHSCGDILRAITGLRRRRMQ